MRQLTLSLAFVLLLLSSSVADAKTVTDKWIWYFSSFVSPDLGSRAFLRWGTADITITERHIRVQFDEPALPELGGVFEGSIDKKGRVKGVLTKFFSESSEQMVGTYREFPSACTGRYLVLEMTYPNGEQIVMMRPRCGS